MHTSPSGGSKFQAIPGPPGYAADSTPQRIRRVGQGYCAIPYIYQVSENPYSRPLGEQLLTNLTLVVPA